MIRSSVFMLAAVASLVVACSAPSNREDLARSSSALEDLSELLFDYPVDYPVLEVPAGIFYPTWGACADGSRAPRAFVKLKKELLQSKYCPEIKGQDGVWIGTPVESMPALYCSYAWKEGSYSEYGWLATIADMSAVNRCSRELEWPMDARPDIRPDCMELRSPCVFHDGGFDCLRIEAGKPRPDYTETKGMSPCGACAESITDHELLVITPDWFTAQERAEGRPRDLIVMTERGRFVFPQPGAEQAFIVHVDQPVSVRVQYDVISVVSPDRTW
jgi:hypothetical protein